LGHLAVSLMSAGLFAMAFIVSQEPHIGAVDKKHGVNYFAVPFGRIEFCFGEESVHTVLLDLGPEEGEASTDEVVPANCLWGGEESKVRRRECGELGHWEVASRMWVSRGSVRCDSDWMRAVLRKDDCHRLRDGAWHWKRWTLLSEE
jgi:hypothetical protein